MVPFIDECHKLAASHPEILPGVFDRAEFERDYQLAKGLGEIGDSLAQLSEAVNHTATAARSDALVASLDIFAAGKLNRDKVLGINGTVDKLSSYFKRPTKAQRTAKN